MSIFFPLLSHHLPNYVSSGLFPQLCPSYFPTISLLWPDYVPFISRVFPTRFCMVSPYLPNYFPQYFPIVSLFLHDDFPMSVLFICAEYLFDMPKGLHHINILVYSSNAIAHSKCTRRFLRKLQLL